VWKWELEVKTANRYFPRCIYWGKISVHLVLKHSIPYEVYKKPIDYICKFMTLQKNTRSALCYATKPEFKIWAWIPRSTTELLQNTTHQKVY